MIKPLTWDLTAYRGVPFVYVIRFAGQDYSGASFRLEVRDYRDDPDEPRVALDRQDNASAEGISVSVETNDGVPTSVVQIRINETTLEAVPYSSPRGGDVGMQYALDVTGGGFGKHRRMQGGFTLEASANG